MSAPALAQPLRAIKKRGVHARGTPPDAVEQLIEGAFQVDDVGIFLVAFTPGKRCECRTCLIAVQDVINQIPGLSFTEKLNGPMNRLITCADCGDKRCPRAGFHGAQCHREKP